MEEQNGKKDKKNKDKDKKKQDKDEKKKPSFMMRAKKNVQGKVVNSAVGRRVLEEIAPEAFKLLDSMKKVISVLDGKKKGSEIKQSLLKLAVKIISLYKSKEITEEVWIHALKLPILRAWSCYVDFCEMPFAVDVPELKGLVDEITNHITRELQKHLSPKNLNLLKDTMAYLGSDDTLTRVFAEGNEALSEARVESGTILRKYWDEQIPTIDKERVHTIQAERAFKGEKKTDWT